jgi:hypothetical protein
MCRRFKPAILQRFVWEPTISLLAQLWRFIVWAWKIIVIGGLLAGILGNYAYTYISAGKFEYTDLSKLPLLQTIAVHPFTTSISVTIGLIPILLSYLANRSLLSSKERRSTEYVLKLVKDLDPNDYIFPYIKDAYLRRQGVSSSPNIDAIAQEELHNIAFQTVTPLRTSLGICIFGRPTQGKTRLAWETIRSVLPRWTLVKWPHEEQHPFDFAAQHGRNLILWLDDLHEFASPNEANALEDLPRQFHEAGASLIIVATCRDGDSETQTRLYLEKLLERLVEIRLTDISPKEADQLTAELNQHGFAAKRSQFDGTPGSLLLGVDRMRNQRYPALSKPAKQVLKAMKLLHSVNIIDV